MWPRNLLFLGLLGGGVYALGANLIPPAEPTPLTTYSSSTQANPEFRDTVSGLNAAFRPQWHSQSLPEAPPAAELTVARRLALGLMGTIPSLEELRQFERL